jgi:prefoldin beta subunit
MTKEKIQEMQLAEQSLQNILLQKQAFQMELAETDAALKEIKKAGDDVYKVVGNLMLKADKSKTKEDLENKKKLLELRLKSLEKQEISLTEKLEKAREDILKASKKK